MANIEIKKVESKSDISKFIKFQFEIYKDDPYWVAPLIFERKQFFNKKKNPFFQHAEMDLFLAYRDGKIVGRVAAINNYLHQEIHKDKVGFFGFYEVINDQEVSDKLLDTAKEWLLERGFDTMRGPMSPSINEEHSLLLEGRNGPPVLQMAYTAEYYLQLLENYGMKKAKDLYAWKIVNEKMSKSEKLFRVAEIARKRSGIKIRTVNIKDFDNELNKVKEVYNKAWEPNWGFVPLTDAEIEKMGEDFKMLIDPDVVIFGEIDGKTVGFALAVPDYNIIFKEMKGKLFPFNFLKLWTMKKKLDTLRIIILGVIPEYQKRGLDAVFYTEIMNRGHVKGYDTAEASWILEDNDMMNRGAEVMQGERYRVYRILEMPIK